MPTGSTDPSPTTSGFDVELGAASAMTAPTTRVDVAWTQSDGSLQDRLTLADWRRRVATLYGEVRAMAASDPVVALAHWRTVREWLFREHPQSPLPPAE